MPHVTSSNTYTDCCIDEFLFSFSRAYAARYSHWLIYHVFLLPKWIDTQNAAHTHTHKSFSRSANVLLRLPSVAERWLRRIVTYHWNAYMHFVLLGGKKCTHERRKFTFFLFSSFCDLNLNRLFIRMYYFHTFVRVSHHRRRHHHLTITTWVNESHGISQRRRKKNK